MLLIGNQQCDGRGYSLFTLNVWRLARQVRTCALANTRRVDGRHESCAGINDSRCLLKYLIGFLSDIALINTCLVFRSGRVCTSVVYPEDHDARMLNREARAADVGCRRVGDTSYILRYVDSFIVQILMFFFFNDRLTNLPRIWKYSSQNLGQRS